MIGIRLDSGDLAWLSAEARRMLDEAGFTEAKIMASNELDEQIIGSLKEQGATINVWGVGTRLVTAYDQPALGGVYKLAALRDEQGHWQPKVKLSEQAVKISTPGILQVRRFMKPGEAIGDVIFDELAANPRSADDGRSVRSDEAKSHASRCHRGGPIGPCLRMWPMRLPEPNSRRVAYAVAGSTAAIPRGRQEVRQPASVSRRLGPGTARAENGAHPQNARRWELVDHTRGPAALRRGRIAEGLAPVTRGGG